MMDVIYMGNTPAGRQDPEPARCLPRQAHVSRRTHQAKINLSRKLELGIARTAVPDPVVALRNPEGLRPRASPDPCQHRSRMSIRAWRRHQGGPRLTLQLRRWARAGQEVGPRAGWTPSQHRRLTT